MKLQSLVAVRSYRADILGSILFKGFAIVCSFILIPVMLKYLGPETFGVWIAIFSIVSWVIFFDLGFASGLRNKLSETLSRGDFRESSILISTAYGAMAILSFSLYMVFVFLNFFISWQDVFNTTVASSTELAFTMAIMVLLFLVNFTLMIILQVLHACQKTSVTVVHQFLSNFLALIVILAVRFLIEPSLMVICVAYGGSQILATLIISVAFFRKNNHILPGISLFHRDRIKSIASLGGQFFIIQLAVLVIFGTDKIIIVNLFGPEDLTGYELIFKIFSSILIVNTLFLAPLWSRYTHAAEANDLPWMRKALLQSNVVGGAMLFPIVLLCCFGAEIIDFWAGYNIDGSAKLLIPIAIFVILRVWTDIYAYFLNGVGVIKGQMWLAVLQAVVNIPLSIWLGKQYGVAGVVYGSVLTLSLSGVVLPCSVFLYFKKVERLRRDISIGA